MGTTSIDYGQAFQPVVEQAQNGITQVLPLGLTVAGIVIAIFLAYKIFKRFTGR